MYFRENAAGEFIAHAYRFVAADERLNGACSTFVVECAPETWLRAGFDQMGEAEACAYLANVFAEPLQGQVLLANKFLRGINFPIIKSKLWHHGNLVLMGDALHTEHFSIGSGTKLALADAASFADAFAGQRSVPAALEKLSASASASAGWMSSRRLRCAARLGWRMWGVSLRVIRLRSHTVRKRAASASAIAGSSGLRGTLLRAMTAGRIGSCLHPAQCQRNGWIFFASAASATLRR